MYNIIKTRKIWFSISMALIAVTLVAAIMYGFNLGIDFTGGSLLYVEYPDGRPSVEEVEEQASSVPDLGEANIQTTGDNGIILKMGFISNEQRQEVMEALPGAEEQSFESIGPVIGEELKRKSWIAILLVLIGIVGYLSWAFRGVSKGPVPSWMYGVAALGALAHDVIITLGVFLIIGHFFGVELNIMFITAILTVLGYSVNDTIVVFDRIREGLKTSHQDTFEGVVNEAVNHTITRSLNTSLTTLFVLAALFLFGGETIKYFVLALMVGIITGTYSSIFIASPLLLWGAKVLKR
ncbi:protein translocase subunit SecF [Patescibacteria group bacterium]|nr:protein translocase subunit SecF [Patescibacteria group bacterium]MBU1673711.1 protein translocase subunit SecF [Patescibacteria group bacterium]MBU1963059.1 protein translocase subunit SecF [Patescibacteria group bacterium]